MIFVNFKTYREGTGNGAIKLAKICQKISQITSLEIIPLVQSVDISSLTKQGFSVWAQHADDIEYGPNTGQVLPEAVLAAGAQGTLLNHSENKMPVPMIKSLTARCRKLGLKTLVCSEAIEEAEAITEAQPDFLAYEPAEFIGSRTDSVSTARPEVISEFTMTIKKVPVLVGAGIHSSKDVKIALELGAQGILVSSDVVLSENPEKELSALSKGFK